MAVNEETIKVTRIHKDAKIPERHSKGAAGYDICSIESGVIQPKERVTIKTGLVWMIPDNAIGGIYGRSGLAVKHSIDVTNNRIYPGNKSELMVELINHGKNPFIYNAGDRIAQLIFFATAGCEITFVENLDDTERGKSGFGSTGMN